MRTFLTAFKLFLTMTVLTGFAYPLLVTGYAMLFHGRKAGGSIVYTGGKAAGSELIAQKFNGPLYFHPRPSEVDYNTLPSGGSNLSPASAALRKLAAARAAAEGDSPDMAYASASGLDPDISPAAALAQADRVAQARRAPKVDIMSLVGALTEQRSLGVLGEPRVNVLALNLALDKKYPYAGK